MKQSGTIMEFTNSEVTFKRDISDKSVRIPYIANGNFNHTYTGEHVELVIDFETGVAIDCINKRHRVNKSL